MRQVDDQQTTRRSTNDKLDERHNLRSSKASRAHMVRHSCVPRPRGDKSLDPTCRYQISEIPTIAETPSSPRPRQRRGFEHAIDARSNFWSQQRDKPQLSVSRPKNGTEPPIMAVGSDGVPAAGHLPMSLSSPHSQYRGATPTIFSHPHFPAVSVQENPQEIL
jgi:hypothetical protein